MRKRALIVLGIGSLIVFFPYLLSILVQELFGKGGWYPFYVHWAVGFIFTAGLALVLLMIWFLVIPIFNYIFTGNFEPLD
jgi:lipopolysaccharide export LptBFGC system permease protein LptF